MTNFKSGNVNEEDDEAWDALFPCRTDDMDDYLNLEGPGDEMQDIRPSA